jgi:hypothetical protein
VFISSSMLSLSFLTQDLHLDRADPHSLYYDMEHSATGERDDSSIANDSSEPEESDDSVEDSDVPAVRSNDQIESLPSLPPCHGRNAYSCRLSSLRH